MFSELSSSSIEFNLLSELYNSIIFFILFFICSKLNTDFLLILLHIWGKLVDILIASIFFKKYNSLFFDLTLTLNGLLCSKNIITSPKCSFFLIPKILTYLISSFSFSFSEIVCLFPNEALKILWPIPDSKILLLNPVFLSKVLLNFVFLKLLFIFEDKIIEVPFFGSNALCDLNIGISKYLLTFSWGLDILIGNSTDKIPCLTNIISSTISLSFIKISFLYAITGLKESITLTIKSVFWKFLKNIKLLIIGLYISQIKLFLRLTGKHSKIIFFNFFSWKFLNFKNLNIFSYNSSGKFGLFNFISSKNDFFFSKSADFSFIFWT